MRFGDQPEDTVVVSIKALLNHSGGTSLLSNFSGTFSVLPTPSSRDHLSLLADHLIEGSDEPLILCVGKPDLVEFHGVVERNPPSAIGVEGVSGSDLDDDVADLSFSLGEAKRVETGDLLARGQKPCEVATQQLAQLLVGRPCSVNAELHTGGILRIAVDVQLDIFINAKGLVGDVLEVSNIDH